MANIKIAQLTNQTAISDNNLIIVETATSTNKMTVGKLKELLGIQSGGIVESGNNANGRYIKFSDGTLICYGSFQAGLTNTSSGNGVYRYDVNFPMTFISNPMVSAFENQIATFTRNFNISVGSQTNSLRLFTTQGPTLAFQHDYMAIGRWR